MASSPVDERDENGDSYVIHTYIHDFQCFTQMVYYKWRAYNIIVPITQNQDIWEDIGVGKSM